MKLRLLNYALIVFGSAFALISNANAAMMPLTNTTLAGISAKGIDITANAGNITLYVQNNITIQPSNNSAVAGSLPGVSFSVETTNGSPSVSQSQQPSINISGMNGSSFISFNSVNSAVNVGVNIIVVMNSNITNFNPTQQNLQNGYNFVNSYFTFSNR